MLLLVHSDFDVRMSERYTLRARDNTLQPFVPVILILRITIVVLAESAWRGVNAIAPMTLATAKESTGLASAFQQIGQCAPGGGLDEQHAAESRAGFAR